MDSNDHLPGLPSAQSQEAARFHDQRTNEVKIIFIALIPSAVVAVILRLVSRRLARMSLWWDDYMTLVALVIATGLNVDLLLETFHGLGQHLEFVGLKGLIYIGKVFNPSEDLLSVFGDKKKADILG